MAGLRTGLRPTDSTILATVGAWNARNATRIAAAAIAVALQGVLYWLMLSDAGAPTAPLGSVPLEATILQATRRMPQEPPHGKSRQRAPQRQIAASRRAPTPARLVGPQQVTQPAPHAPVDWQQAMQREVRSAESRSRGKRLRFGFPQLPVAPPPAPAFGWDYAATHRLEPLRTGGMVIHLTDRCVLVVYGFLLFPGCALGRIPANGHLFDDMRAPRGDSGRLP